MTALESEILTRMERRLERMENILIERVPGATVSGKQAAKMLGVSYVTFKARFVDTRFIKPSVGKRYLRAHVERLKERLNERDIRC